MPRTASVSLCQIVRNEAHQLAECLTPVAGLFDEIVIVDTGSCDETRDVARRFTPQVFEFPWRDDFAAARNETLRHATGDWIFWLDADDRLTPENVARLRTLLESLADERRVYMMDTRCAMSAASDGQRAITHPRLFRRHPELKWRGRVHEQLRPAPVTLGYETLFSDVRIEHLGYQEAAARQRKLQRDIRLLRLDYAVDPDDVSTLLHLGLAYARQGNYPAARESLQRVLGGVPPVGDHLRQVHGSLAEMALSEGNFPEVLRVTERGLQSFPDEEFLWYVRAEAHVELDQHAAAKQTLARLLALPSVPRYSGGGLCDIRRRYAPRVLANVYRLERNFVAAEATLRTLLVEFPDDTLGWYLLGWVYLDTDRRQPMEEAAAALAGCVQGHLFHALLWASYHMLHGELDASETYIDRLVAEIPQMPLPRVLRCELLARRGAPPAAQIQACRDLLRVQPHSAFGRQLLAHLEQAQRPAAAVSPSDWCTSVVLGAGVPQGIALA